MKKYTKFLFLSILCFYTIKPISSQTTHNQTIRGTVIDRDSKFSIPGANILIQESDFKLGAVTDFNGAFKIENVPLGRHNIIVSFIGYKNAYIPNVLVGSGKEVVLNIELEETTINMKEVVVKSEVNKEKTQNEMSIISSRTFSVEETSKYAGSLNDPGRMALSFAGVSGGGNDATNELVIRGNSPRGMLWQIEGIPVTNPNHFAEEGQTGGGVCLISNNLMDNSDFSTGAWAPGYGNALSGIFDIKLRKGNNQKRENTFQFSTLGVDLATEGPIKKDWFGSYLINYRYSTFGLLEKGGIHVLDENDGVPLYQDLSYKIFLPFKKAGSFSIWGIHGRSEMTGKNVVNLITSSEGIDYNYLENSRDFSKADIDIYGITHKYFIGKRSFIKTGLSHSSSHLVNEEDGRLEPLQAISIIGVEEKDDFKKNTSVLTSHLNTKFNSKHTFRAGFTFSHLNYEAYRIEFNDELQQMETDVDDESKSNLLQSFMLSKYKFSDNLTMVGGIHFMHYDLSAKTSIEPRLSISYNISDKHSISAGIGQHSQLQPLSLYIYRDASNFQQKNRNLDFSKARHYVISYNYIINENLRLKSDIYYQQLYSIPIASNEILNLSDRLNSYSVINYSDGIDYIPLENEGEGTNYGIEITLERFFSNNWYFLTTTSLYESKYESIDGIERNTRFNGNYIFNFLAGKDFELTNKNIISLNARIISTGGQRYTPIKEIIEATDDNGDLKTDFKGDQVYIAVYDYENAFSEQFKNYFRMDLGMSYRINKSRVAHIISLDIQNVTNNENIREVDGYDFENNKFEYEYQAGLIPVLKYRLEF